MKFIVHKLKNRELETNLPTQVKKTSTVKSLFKLHKE